MFDVAMDIIDSRLITCGTCANRDNSRLYNVVEYGLSVPAELLDPFFESLDAEGYGPGEQAFCEELMRQAALHAHEAAGHNMVGGTWTAAELLAFQKLVAAHAYRGDVECESPRYACITTSFWNVSWSAVVHVLPAMLCPAAS